MTVRPRSAARGSQHARSRSAKASRSSPSKARTGSHAPAQTRVVLVTGMSGAGRSSTLKALEDLGYEAVDNLPISLLSRIARPPAPGAKSKAAEDQRDALSSKPRALAIGVDIRTRDFSVEPFLEELDQLRHVLPARG